MVICQGCGQAFPIPAGYTRNKIQCPGCGVICAVPADVERQPARPPGRKARATPEPAAEDQAANLLNDSEPLPMMEVEPVAVAAPVPAAAPRKAPASKKPALPFQCRRCGRAIRKQRECPSCDAVEEAEQPVDAFQPHSLELDDAPAGPGQVEDEDDASPYLFAEKDRPVCPKCKSQLPADSVFCTSCGFDMQRRKKRVRTYQPMARTWETDYPLRTRLTWVGAAMSFHALWIFLNLVGGGGTWPIVVAPLLLAILSFVFGTYEQLELTRDEKGRVWVTKQWRFCFMPMKPETTAVRGFEGVTTGQWHDAGFLEWFVLGSLLFLFLVPAIIWWYVAIHKEHYHVALAVDHGHSELYLYRGRSQEQMNEIADAVCNATGLQRLG